MKEINLREENSRLKAQLSALATLGSQIESEVSGDVETIDLKELLIVLWAGKWLILCITGLFAISSLVFALNIPNEYRSTAILAPASKSNAGALNKLAGQFGGLATLAGINVGGNQSDKTAVAIEVIKTWGFIESFVEDNQIQAEVFAAKGWSKSSNSLIYDEKIYDSKSKLWVRKHDPSKGETAEPSSWELYKEFHKRININQDKATGLITLSLEYYSPDVAKEWIDKLVYAINFHTKQQDKADARKNVTYLENQIKLTNVAEMRAVFYQLIEEQTKVLMLAEVSDEYVFKIVSPAKVPEEKSKPRRAIICIFGTFLGGIISIIAVLVFHYFRTTGKTSSDDE